MSSKISSESSVSIYPPYTSINPWVFIYVDVCIYLGLGGNPLVSGYIQYMGLKSIFSIYTLFIASPLSLIPPNKYTP
jgi:hypothetical protein